MVPMSILHLIKFILHLLQLLSLLLDVSISAHEVLFELHVELDVFVFELEILTSLCRQSLVEIILLLCARTQHLVVVSLSIPLDCCDLVFKQLFCFVCFRTSLRFLFLHFLRLQFRICLRWVIKVKLVCRSLIINNTLEFLCPLHQLDIQQF